MFAKQLSRVATREMELVDNLVHEIEERLIQAQSRLKELKGPGFALDISDLDELKSAIILNQTPRNSSLLLAIWNYVTQRVESVEDEYLENILFEIFELLERLAEHDLPVESLFDDYDEERVLFSPVRALLMSLWTDADPDLDEFIQQNELYALEDMKKFTQYDLYMRFWLRQAKEIIARLRGRGIELEANEQSQWAQKLQEMLITASPGSANSPELTEATKNYLLKKGIENMLQVLKLYFGRGRESLAGITGIGEKRIEEIRQALQRTQNAEG